MFDSEATVEHGWCLLFGASVTASRAPHARRRDRGNRPWGCSNDCRRVKTKGLSRATEATSSDVPFDSFRDGLKSFSLASLMLRQRSLKDSPCGWNLKVPTLKEV